MGLFDDAEPRAAPPRHGDQLLLAGRDDPAGAAAAEAGVKPIVVNVSSILGHRGVPYSSEYCASKFAVQGFSEAIRAEFTQLGIDVLVVSPGTTETEFFDRVIEQHGEAEVAEAQAGQRGARWPGRWSARSAAAGTRSSRIAGAASSAGSIASRRGWSMG